MICDDNFWLDNAWYNFGEARCSGPFSFRALGLDVQV